MQKDFLETSPLCEATLEGESRLVKGKICERMSRSPGEESVGEAP